METIKVNMTPCEDVKTIHASQNDNEARQWGFELHNNGEKIDSSSISDQLVFKAYEGGTEEILPANGSTPTTSPFKGDIKYPQGLLSDQEFTYRQSPTEEDGLAKITDIKGNTLVWNQLAKELNATNWLAESATASYSNGICTLTPSGYNGRISADADIIANHKYLMLGDFTNVDNQPVYFYIGAIGSYSTGIRIPQTSVLTRQSKIYTATETGKIYIRNNSNTGVVTIKNLMLFDLTQMGLDITDPSEFTSLFSLPYYDFNQGTLLSFNGNGLKTVGKNLLNVRTTQINNGITFTNNNGIITINGTATGNAFFTTTIGLRDGSYFIGAFNDEIGNVHVAVQTKSGAYVLDATMSVKNRVVSINNDINNFIIWVNSGTTLNNFVLKPMISFDSPEYFEPYTEFTLSIPLDEFPNGMDGINDVKDEKNETGYVKRIGTIVLNGSELWHSPDSSGNCWINLYAMKRSLDYRETMKSNIAVSQSCRAMNTTEVSVSGYPSEQSDGTNWLYIRLPNQDQTIANITAYLQEHPVTVEFELYNPLENYGVVDMGSLNWSRRNDVNGAFFTKIDDMALGVANKLSNLLCPLYATRNTAYYGQLSSFVNMEIAQGNATQGEVYLINTSYSDVATFKTAMSGVYLLYEKQNPQGFTTATLVTENGEVALANENGVLVGKCNSDVSADAGFIEGKIKLSDSDGDVYSNKIQIHVERSPQ